MRKPKRMPATGAPVEAWIATHKARLLTELRRAEESVVLLRGAVQALDLALTEPQPVAGPGAPPAT